MPLFRIDPIAKPRMTRSDKWNERPAVLRYWAFKDELQREAGRQGFILPPAFTVTFYIPMPQSWSKAKKQRYLHKPHQQKPDLDNLIKALNDSLASEDDTYIWFVNACKVWALEGAIMIDKQEDL